MRCCKWIVDSLRSTCCEECNSSRIPPDPNETSAIASYSNATYFSDNKHCKNLSLIDKSKAL